MLKKFLVLGISLIMLFSFIACDSGDELVQLTQYKITAKDLIDDHIATKSQNDYSEENWDVILQAVMDGKTAIDAANTKKDVDEAVTIAKNMINLVETFCGNPHESLDFLSNELQEQIRQEYLESKIKPNYPQATINNIKIDKYLGSYVYHLYETSNIEGDGIIIAIMLSDSFSEYTNEESVWDRVVIWKDESLFSMTEVIEQVSFDIYSITVVYDTGLDVSIFMEMIKLQENNHLLKYYGTYNNSVVVLFNKALFIPELYNETIADITFNYGSKNPIKIFKDDTFYSMQQAYDLDFLTIEDIIFIKKIHTPGWEYETK